MLKKPTLIIDLQIAEDIEGDINNNANNIKNVDTPSLAEFQLWAEMSIAEIEEEQHNNYEITIRIVADDEMQYLNKTYRNQDKPTNILSFPAQLTDIELLALSDESSNIFLGDLVVDIKQLKREAAEQSKSISDHWAHLIIHGTLHLLGFDHIENSDAEEMENIEIKILNKLKIANPYL